MNPSNEVKKFYQKIVTDSLYKDSDKWFYDSTYDRYVVKYNTITIQYYYDSSLVWIYIGDHSFNIKTNMNIRYLMRKFVKEYKKKAQRKVDNICMDAVPISTLRRLKIEKIYK